MPLQQLHPRSYSLAGTCFFLGSSVYFRQTSVVKGVLHNERKYPDLIRTPSYVICPPYD
ncbi:hypothetical protein RchiOBHm_Chr1g0358511 [Rosa chinensis]|uniref:Uncharacterized protein n=1 Tax=Rosa chinensis TaxID=74649 RepID=A0A2P6SI60_ROSCH|nr:hypothetical protein RchiOBHm_Chr1g0358511 [Rosa chinensis]